MGKQRNRNGRSGGSNARRGSNSSGERYVLKLYIAGMTPRSVRAVENVKAVCETHLRGRYRLKIIDIYQQPTLAKGDQIIAVPTLLKKLPAPLRTLIGDLSNAERVLVGLDLRQVKSRRGTDVG